MEIENANSVVDAVENANANSQEVNKGTQENDNSTNTTMDNVGQSVDYATKFSESSKEALRLYQENKALKEALELKDNKPEHQVQENTDSYYPGFESLDEDAKQNLIAYTNTVTKRAKEELLKDPAIAFAKKQYNEQVWDSALQKTLRDYPELAETKDEFKSKYFNVNNVPTNIETILKDIAKIHLYDKAKQIGAKEETEKINRVELERSTAGSKNPTVGRSIEDWQRMAMENPAEFARHSKEYNSDLSSKKI
jgi:hypothetical protein